MKSWSTTRQNGKGGREPGDGKLKVFFFCSLENRFLSLPQLFTINFNFIFGRNASTFYRQREQTSTEAQSEIHPSTDIGGESGDENMRERRSLFKRHVAGVQRALREKAFVYIPLLWTFPTFLLAALPPVGFPSLTRRAFNRTSLSELQLIRLQTAKPFSAIRAIAASSVHYFFYPSACVLTINIRRQMPLSRSVDLSNQTLALFSLSRNFSGWCETVLKSTWRG